MRAPALSSWGARRRARASYGLFPNSSARSCPQPHLRDGLTDEAAAEANRHRVRAGTRLKLGQEVADVGLDRLLREIEPLADLPIHETVGDELQHLDLAPRRLLLELGTRALEGDDRRRSRARRAPARGDLLEPSRVVEVPVEDLLPFSGVHERTIGAPAAPL